MKPDARAIGGDVATEGALLGRWRTAPSGRFTSMDHRVWELVSLPLVPLTSLGWHDLVVPGTDLGFLGRSSFSGQAIRVGISGGVRTWVLAGRRIGPGGGMVGEIHAPAAPSAPSPTDRTLRGRGSDG